MIFFMQGLPGAYGQKGVSGAKVRSAVSDIIMTDMSITPTVTGGHFLSIAFLVKSTVLFVTRGLRVIQELLD